MGAFYVKGETKARAGVYRRYENRREANITYDNGVVAIVLTSNWGPMEATVIESIEAARRTYGDSSGVKKTLLMVMNQGVTKTVVCRAGSGGSKATLTLKDTTSGTAVSVVKLDTKYPTDRAFKISVRDKAGDTTTKLIDVIEGTTVLESFAFSAGDDEVSAIVDTINASSYILDASKIAAGNGRLGNINQSAMTSGTNPSTPSNNDYSAALSKVEPYRFDVLIVDTDSTDVHAIVQAFMERVKEDGLLNMAVLGEPTSVDLNTRLEHSKAFNSENIVFVGGSYVDGNGDVIEGAAAAAVVAAKIATTPSSTSIVHSVISDAVEVKEKLTNTQHEKAIRSGCIMFSESSDGVVWVESGINTLVTLGEEQDEGWKKIKRVRTRHELIDRIQRALEPVIGKINCDNDGVANVINVGKKVIEQMVAEAKLYAGDMYEDPENPHYGDSAWFIIQADDIDVMEKIYLTYQFRFSANA